MDLTFGDRVSVSKKYKRILNKKYKSWQPAEYVRSNCIYLGKRRLSNGEIWIDYEEGTTYKPLEYFMAALVCADEKSKPVYVPLTSISPAWHF